MIGFNYETDFRLSDESLIKDWLIAVAENEGYCIEEVNYIFCDDAYLHKLNLKYLEHDALTDVIGFDYTIGKNLQGDIFISEERVRENAIEFGIHFMQELKRVMVHGLLHFCGWKDKSEADKSEMRAREDFHLSNSPVV